MRRYIVLMLLIVLPFQFCWAAAATYCSHENTATATHFGHHDHQHHANSQGDSTSKNLKAKIAPMALDDDCSVCHSCAAPSVLPSLLAHAEPFGNSMPLPAPLLFDSYVPSGMERPDRSIVA